MHHAVHQSNFVISPQFPPQTALHHACISGHHEVVRMLLLEGAPAGTTYEDKDEDEDGEIKFRGNALTLAIRNQNRECVRVFLETANDEQGHNLHNSIEIQGGCRV